MITVSTDFKNAVKGLVKQNKYRVSTIEAIPIVLTDADDLKGININAETSIAKTVMRYGEIEVYGNHDLLGKTINIEYGVVLPSTTVEYMSYGRFRVEKTSKLEHVEFNKLKIYDLMYESLRKWDLIITLPTTLYGLLQQICTELGWTLGSGSIPNGSIAITSDTLTGVVSNYREVLDFIAQASGTLIKFNNSNELVAISVAKTSYVETIDPSILNTYEFDNKYGVINSVVLSRQPQEDNIAQQDSASITANGLTEVKFSNNWIVDSDRATYIGAIFTQFNDLYFYPFAITCNGLNYLEVGDRIRLQNVAGAYIETVIFGHEIKMSTGIKERFYAKLPDTSNTNYDTAGVIGKTIRNTEIKVDKQNGTIQLLTEDVNESIAQINLTTESITASVNQTISLVDANSSSIEALQSSVASLELTSEALEVSVSGIGGTNLLKNSVGLKGTLVEWQTYASGVLVDARNNGTLVQTSTIEQNTESGSAIQILNQFINQTVPTIAGQTYTLYFRYYSNGSSTLSISGQTDTTLPTSAGWQVYKKQFIAGAGSVTIKFNTGAGITATFSDIICKLGDVNGWMQAPNEVYGLNFRFDKDGFEITSETSAFKSLLDNEKLAVYDTSSGDKIVMYVSKDSGIITNLIVQDQLTIQRYDNTDKAMRIMPSSTGVMFVIND